ncbi:hypothetical protein V6N11_068347 [Hibiscus sabdariffa]|uniref:HIT domain-containing protein n=2 Tax=Hibiscus sabdariffa TaxID=183260 RepID=A0ABR2C9Z5_9ROSI
MPASGGRISAFSAASHGLHLHMYLIPAQPSTEFARRVQQAMNFIPALICKIHAQPSTEFARRVQKATCQP